MPDPGDYHGYRAGTTGWSVRDALTEAEHAEIDHSDIPGAGGGGGAGGETATYTHTCDGSETALALGVPDGDHTHYGLTVWVPETALELRVNFNVDDVDLELAPDAVQLGQAGPAFGGAETSMLLAEMTVPFYQAATPFARVWRVQSDVATDALGLSQISEQPLHAPLTDASSLHLICLDSGDLSPVPFPAGTRVEVRVK